MWLLIKENKMGYKLEFPYTEQDFTEFLDEHQTKGLKIVSIDNFVEVEKTEEITEEREIVDEETGEVIGTETVVVDTKTYTETINYPTYYALEKNEIMVNDVPVVDPEYEEKEAQKERERIGNLKLTGADVERGIYQAKGIDFEDIIEMVETLIFAEAPQVKGLDLKALRIELKANHFYRGNPYVNAVGALLGFTEEQLDKFFEFNDYTYLLPPVEPEEPIEVEDENTENATV
jgi:hypothetical protein